MAKPTKAGTIKPPELPFWIEIRRALLIVLNAIEIHYTHTEPRTAELRTWWKKQYPTTQ